YLIKATMKVIPTFPGLKKSQKKFQKEVKIKTITLDRLIEIVGQPVDLVQMDVQGLETDILQSGFSCLKSGVIKTFLVGTHGFDKHHKCIDLFKQQGYLIEFEESQTKNQPDGIIVASKGIQRLKK
ncbi:MAG: FkbM family methyltransferase, partial [Oscillatoria sp. PMC 1076.18]|nr:FkbM family methyltransferase [Oscillatoria sp. PMC 1076.18]